MNSHFSVLGRLLTLLSVLVFTVPSFAQVKKVSVVSQISGPNQYTMIEMALDAGCRGLTDSDWLQVEIKLEQPLQVMAFNSKCNVELVRGPGSSEKIVAHPMLQGTLVIMAEAGFKMSNFVLESTKNITLQFHGTSRSQSAPRDEPIELSRVSVSAPDELAVFFNDVKRPIKLNDITIKNGVGFAPTVTFFKNQKPVEVTGLTLDGKLSVSQVSEFSLKDSRIKVDEGSGQVAAEFQASNANVIDSSFWAMGATALEVSGIGLGSGASAVPGKLRLSGGRITGQVTLRPGGFASIIGATFGPTSQVGDAGEGCGLQEDPTKANTGLTPAQLSSSRDFNHNGCQDYPVENDQRDPETGKCVSDGIPISPM